MNKSTRITAMMFWALSLFGSVTLEAQTFTAQALEQTIVTPAQEGRYLWLPIQESAPEGKLQVIVSNVAQMEQNVRFAREKVDYYVALDMQPWLGAKGLSVVIQNVPKGSVCFSKIKQNDDKQYMLIPEKYRPSYHHAPERGWMNDPNGLFFKDGVWHLYYQYNPYGSMWGNMHWAHSTSTDLVHWQQQPVALAPDAWGTMFSGSCVVDHNNTAGFGKDAIISMYTSSRPTPFGGDVQAQCIAYSNDGGKTFTKYVGNPVITDEKKDFRDPHVFWNEEAGFWNMILAAGQEMQIYSSANLKDWKYESSFGHEYGNHGGVWECPDLMKMKVRGTDKEKWMLICNINPGGPFGGSATQYFIGDFDGHKFTCEDDPSETKWMDYGKDHYATITFDNAPEGRHVGIAWMSNWQYANQVPTKQYRSANSIVRDFGLFEYKGETYCSITPAKEMLAARGARVSQPTEACEIVVTVKGDAQITLSNAKGESVVMTYDDEEETFDMDRRRSGNISFSDAFPVATSSPTYGKVRQLRIFVDRCSVEAFDGDGKMCMTNLVFPSTPYDKITVKGKAKAAIYKIKTQN
ncbi:GH32 C-terminal domain-containing protein [Prevotella sp. P5-92]|uniref:GH32 C-terminal domain-containing protein n=1 Tax=Prevotella sp. P5-92 TaxID=2024222 RepID=UPI0020B15933|nr:GH32 C-terminal domain-containing protein [Prevotella sp. P5-92]